jgi:hypothetical protein
LIGGSLARESENFTLPAERRIRRAAFLAGARRQPSPKDAFWEDPKQIPASVQVV